ncbi:alcohol acetyltransferase-domain-containing protein [Xylaria palmicola]|nr:alcohol acetyltransferase-domain-containing protein [Xylaria palmicola]
MHTLDQYRGTIVACRYSLPRSLASAGALTTLQSTFYNAVAHVVLAQPHLQTGLVGENSPDPVFVRLDQVDLSNHVYWIVCDDARDLEKRYRESLESELDSRYSNLATQPGWRVDILKEADAESIEVLYVWNHPHHDGMSGKIFHEQLLRSLHGESINGMAPPTPQFHPGSTSWVLDLPDSSARLPPPPEILSSWPISPPFFLRFLWKELKPHWLFPGTTHALWAPVHLTPFKTQLRTFVVDGDTVAKLVGACHQHDTTITGLFHALVLLSLSPMLGDMKGFASRTPYNLRPILPSKTAKYPWLEPKESMCNYVSVIDHEFDTSVVSQIRSQIPDKATDVGLSPLLDIVWDVAARIRREIKARLDSGLRNDVLPIMRLVHDWRAQQESEAQKPRYLSWLVTNLGVLDGGGLEKRQDPERWAIRKADLLLSAEVPSAALSVSLMTVKDEQMCVTCTWQDCVVEESLVQHLMDDLKRWVDEITS